MADMRSAMKRAGYSDRQGSGHGHRRGQERPRGQQAAMPTLPRTYFLAGDEEPPCLDTAFVSKDNLDRTARYLRYNAKPALTTGQIRRFFNHCRAIERRLVVEGEPWKRVAASFEMLGCHAQNAQAASKIPREFQKFIDENVARVTSSTDPKTAFMKGFLPHFEALVGFGAAHLKPGA